MSKLPAADIQPRDQMEREFLERGGQDLHALRIREARFAIGQHVRKVRGYRFPGSVRAVFTTEAGEVRYVVEAEGPDFVGMLHIYNEEQLDVR